MTPDQVRMLARSAPGRWSALELVHRSEAGDLHAHLRHGLLEGRWLPDGPSFREVGAPASTWDVRPLEPYPTNYLWSAMLDPYELGDGVEISDVREVDVHGRPAVGFVAHATEDYDPVCSCCPLVFSEASERLERGDGWEPTAGDFPDGVEIALDLEVGIVVSSRDRGGRLGSWSTTEILRVATTVP